jgi:hypothetical protein
MCIVHIMRIVCVVCIACIVHIMRIVRIVCVVDIVHTVCIVHIVCIVCHHSASPSCRDCVSIVYKHRVYANESGGRAQADGKACVSTCIPCCGTCPARGPAPRNSRAWLKPRLPTVAGGRAAACWKHSRIVMPGPGLRKASNGRQTPMSQPSRVRCCIVLVASAVCALLHCVLVACACVRFAALCACC